MIRAVESPMPAGRRIPAGVALALSLLSPAEVRAQTTAPLEPVKTSITVVEKIVTESPASISVVEEKELRRTPGINLDDRLRMLPGFSLFRRNSSLVAHPTTQGISLRGIGSTGTSRTLVLWDGIPVNDPFGGWVYWTRFAPEELQRVEVARGAATSVFGDRALGGTIALFSREPERYRLRAGYEGGNLNSHEVSAGFSHLWQRFAASLDGRAFTTDGFFIVPENIRGPIDEPAGVRFVAGDARVDYLGRADRLFLKVDLLAEERKNGTMLQRNSTGLGNLAAQYRREFQRDGISVTGFHTREEFRSSFSAIGAGRATERITFLQTVPAEAVGGAALWKHSSRSWNLLAGADVNRVEGYSTDTFSPTDKRVGGGVQLQHGVFAQTDFEAGPARFFLGARNHVTGDHGSFFSPSAGLVAGRGRFRGRGSVYRSFRAPTLNELFREFRVGNAVTQANPALRPETLFGAEAGLDVVGETNRASFTVFRNSLDDLITNVTLSSTPALVVRQRQNAASALSRGVEFDFRQRYRNFYAEFGYLFADSRFPTGERIPQVPRHQGSGQITWQRDGSLVAVGVRNYSKQWEDDRNTAVLGAFAVWHLAVRQRLVRGLAAVLNLENALDRQYLTGLSPTPTIGQPRVWRAGLRWEGRLR
jgi:outer membrane receptor protein involved in Fe transport